MCSYKLCLPQSKSPSYTTAVPPPPTDEQPMTNLCQTYKPPGQQTIVVFDPWTMQYKNVLQSMYYSINPLEL